MVEEQPFARYVYNDTRGMPWNRAHALNSGARLCQGEHILCTDVDLIYSRDALRGIAGAAGPAVVGYGRFFILPEDFSDWASLDDGSSTSFPLSHKGTLGAIQLLPKAVFLRVHGFDEFFRIWGVEDYDFRLRLERAGCAIRWMELRPVYHQWHPGSALPEMPTAWLEVMNFHSLARRENAVVNSESWGRILTPESRPSLKISPSDTGAGRLEVPIWVDVRIAGMKFRAPAIGAWARIEFMRQLLGGLSAAKSGDVVVCEVVRSTRIRIWELLARTVLRSMCPPVAGRRYFDFKREARDIIWYTLLYADLVEDYSIEGTKDRARYVLVRK
jgi:hypothetical protein